MYIKFQFAWKNVHEYKRCGWYTGTRVQKMWLIRWYASTKDVVDMLVREYKKIRPDSWVILKNMERVQDKEQNEAKTFKNGQNLA